MSDFCDHMDCSLPESCIHGISQAGILEWVAHQAPLSMEFPRQEYWSGLPSPSPEDFPDPGIKPASLALAGKFFTTMPPGKLQLDNSLLGVGGNSIYCRILATSLASAQIMPVTPLPTKEWQSKHLQVPPVFSRGKTAPAENQSSKPINKIYSLE